MCLSVPARIVQLNESRAEVEVFGERRQVFVAAPAAKVGDWVLLSGGIAIAVLETETAKEIVDLLLGF